MLGDLQRVCRNSVKGKSAVATHPNIQPNQSQVSILARRRDALLKEVDDFTRQDGDEIQNLRFTKPTHWIGVGWGLVGVGWVVHKDRHVSKSRPLQLVNLSRKMGGGWVPFFLRDFSRKFMKPSPF